MKALVLGSGNIGSVAAEDLASSMKSINIIIADKDEVRAKRAAERTKRKNVSWMWLDVADRNHLLSALKDSDLAMGFLPGKLGFNLMKACIEAETDLIDVSYMEEDPFQLDRRARKAGILIVPDCGLAPGISNFLVGDACRQLDETLKIAIYVGGLPCKPVPPLDYTVTWSPESLIDEYTRKATIVKKRRRIEVRALSGIERIRFPRVGCLEAFFTDGLRTLIHTFTNVEDMWEKTLRYPGHVRKIELLEALGFFQEEEIEVDGSKMSPRKLTAKLLGEKLTHPEIGDLVVLRVDVTGIRKNSEERHVYDVFDKSDRKSGLTAMARTTAFPMSIVAQLILKNEIREKGVVPPEKLGMNPRLFGLFVNKLKNRGIETEEQRS